MGPMSNDWQHLRDISVEILGTFTLGNRNI